MNSFEREVGTASSAERLSIDISALKEGSYNLILEVEDSVSKQRVSTERAFNKISVAGASGRAPGNP